MHHQSLLNHYTFRIVDKIQKSFLSYKILYFIDNLVVSAQQNANVLFFCFSIMHALYFFSSEDIFYSNQDALPLEWIFNV